jgi:hypothetical protein
MLFHPVCTFERLTSQKEFRLQLNFTDSLEESGTTSLTDVLQIILMTDFWIL